MKYFSIPELSKSATAARYGIDNTPTPEAVEALTALVDNILDPLREAYGSPIFVHSGFRNHRVNRLVGGVKSSQHLTGHAADIDAGSATENKKLFTLAQSLGLPFDQLIDERGFSWIHISFDPARSRRQILHL